MTSRPTGGGAGAGVAASDQGGLDDGAERRTSLNVRQGACLEARRDFDGRRECEEAKCGNQEEEGDDTAGEHCEKSGWK